MPSPKLFYAYLVDKRVGGTVVSPSPKQQLKLIQKRVAAHPYGRLIGNFREVRFGEKVITNPMAGAFAACKKNNATLLVCDGVADLDRIKGRVKAAAVARRTAIAKNNEKEKEKEVKIENKIYKPADKKPMHRSLRVRVLKVYPMPTLKQKTKPILDTPPEEYFFGSTILNGKTITDFDAIWAAIEQNCSDYLNLVRNTQRLLFRGVYSRIADAYRDKPREDRKPRDVTRAAHEYVVDWMKGENFAAHRGNSLFVSSDYDFVLDFARKSLPERTIVGRVYAIFPCNGSSFTWSRTFKDFGGMLTRRNTLGLDHLPDDIDHLIWVADFVQGSLADAMRSGHEVLVAGSYYAILWQGLRRDEDQYDQAPQGGGYQAQIRQRLETYDPETRAVTNKLDARPFVSLWRSRYEEDNIISSFASGKQLQSHVVKRLNDILRKKNLLLKSAKTIS